MAPEQLEGAEADTRSDLFAFGATLHEMVTGRKSFQGKSQVSLMAAILEHEPMPIVSIIPGAPPLLDYVVKTCLAKNPEKRWQTAGDLLLQLRWISENGSGGAAAMPAADPARRRWLWAGTALVLAALTGVTGWWLKPAPAISSIVTRFTFTLPEGQQFTRTGRRFVAIAPDGSKVAYSIRAAWIGYWSKVTGGVSTMSTSTGR